MHSKIFLRATSKVYDHDWKYTILKLKIYDHFTTGYDLLKYTIMAESKQNAYVNDFYIMKLYDHFADSIRSFDRN